MLRKIYAYNSNLLALSGRQIKPGIMVYTHKLTTHEASVA